MNAAPRTNRAALRPLLSAAWAVVALCAGGCGLSRTDLWPSGRRVSLADFAGADRDGEPGNGGAVQPAPAPPQDEPDPEAPTVWQGPPEDRAVLKPLRPGEPVLVDSLVGQINGKPIFADAFLEPLEDRLLRTAEESSGRELDNRFRQIIFDSLYQVVQSELMLAEAETSLTEQQRMGLFALLDRIYQEQLRLAGGTRSGAEERTRRSGAGLQEYLGTQREVALIRNLISEKIGPRVVVSWREVERQYRKRFADFNPPATVTLARIRLDRATQAALIEDVTRKLEAGVAFALIAGDLELPDGGRWESFTMGPGGIADIGVSADMKRVLEGLKEGDTSKPFALGGSTVWVHVAAVDRRPPRSLYDQEVQLLLVSDVRNGRGKVEFDRYVQSLLKGGIYDDLDQMADRIYKIAAVRYGR